MSKAIALSRRLIAVIILIIIGVSLIVYFFYPQKPAIPTYDYYVAVYDVLGNRTNTIAQNVTVILQGITNSSINITLSKPNYNNVTYQFTNLKAGDYMLKILSNENITLFNKTLYINKDTFEKIVIPAQPLTIQILVNGSPAKVGYVLSLENIDKKLKFNATISTKTGSYSFSEIPIGHYQASLYYLGLLVNQTSFDISGNTNFINLNTKLLNLNFLLKDSKIGVLNQTSLYLIYQGKNIGPYISSSNGTISAQNIPPLNFRVVFSYKGINVTTMENPNIDLSSVTQKSFNFTTTLGNLTLKVSYDNGTPAKGLGVILSPNVKTKLGNEGNATLLNLPAGVNIVLSLNKTYFTIIRYNITLKAYINNTISLIIPKYSLNYTLKAYTDLNKFKIYYTIQDYLNITGSQNIITNNLNIGLYPSIYAIYIFVKTPSNSSVLLYKETLVFNKTLSKTIDVPLGYTINVNTSSPEDKITLYYVDQNGAYMVAQSSGDHASFTYLLPGNYRIVIERGNSFISSSFVEISQNSPSIINLSINTTSPLTLIQTIQESAIVFVVLLIVIAILGYGIYRTYKSKKETK